MAQPIRKERCHPHHYSLGDCQKGKFLLLRKQRKEERKEMQAQEEDAFLALKHKLSKCTMQIRRLRCNLFIVKDNVICFINLDQLNNVMSISYHLHLPVCSERSFVLFTIIQPEHTGYVPKLEFSTSMVQNRKECKCPEAEGLCHEYMHLLLGMVFDQSEDTKGKHLPLI